MTDYTELVKKLRDLHRDPRPASAEWLFENQVALYDAAAAIEELLPKRGEWMNVTDSYFWYGRCSVCGAELNIDGWYAELMNYCPNCGAKMMEAQDEGAGSL